MNGLGRRRLAVVPAALACAGVLALQPGEKEPSAAPKVAPDVALYADARDELLGLLERTDPGVALARLDTLMRERPGVLGMCHILAHEVGRAAVAEPGGFARAMTYPIHTCGGGYVHGAVEARLAAEKQPEVAMVGLCGARPDGLCLHGLGHGAMLVTGNDPPAALRMCDGLNKATEQVQCGEGVFMQHFQTGVAGPHPNRFLDPRDPTRVCRTQRDQYRSACYTYAPLYKRTLHQAVNGQHAQAGQSSP